jgi:hypothetical protein
MIEWARKVKSASMALPNAISSRGIFAQSCVPPSVTVSILLFVPQMIIFGAGKTPVYIVAKISIIYIVLKMIP